MHIFVLGQSGSCKTPFCEAISKELNIRLINASDWIKPLIDKSQFKTKQAYISTATEVSMKELRKNPRACLDFLEANYDLTIPSIIDGIKNPSDFWYLFNIKKDMAVFLNRDPNPYQSNAFESGIVIIDKYLNWSANIGLLDKEKRVNYVFEQPEKDLPEVVDNFLKLFRYRDWCLICGDRGCEHQRNDQSGIKVK